MTARASGERKRARLLGLLTLGAVISSALALAAINSERPNLVARMSEQALYPDFAAASSEAQSIRIESPAYFVTLNKGADNNWTIAERGNYPVSAGFVRTLMLSVSHIDLLEQRTADPSRHAAMELTTGDQGKGRLITISRTGGAVLASFVAGKTQSPAADTMPGTFFVRRNGEDQTYLARGDFSLPASIGDLLDHNLFRLEEGRIATILAKRHGGETYRLTRAAPAAGFMLDSLPTGKEAEADGILKTPASAVSGLTFLDVMPANAFAAKDTTEVTVTTFDGLVLVFTLNAASDDGGFGTISASTTQTASAEVKTESEMINARVKAWAYRFPSFVITNLAPPLASLMHDKAADPRPTP